jgi:hypothetical protein
MWLALTDLFRPRWSAGVHEEWIARSAAKSSRLDACGTRTNSRVDGSARDRRTGDGVRKLIDGLQLPDPNDRHVLAAAIRGHADVIVTMNLRDFPAGYLVGFGIEPQHPDEFIYHRMTLAPGAVVTAARQHRASLKNPPKSQVDYIDTLEAQGLTQTALALREYTELL